MFAGHIGAALAIGRAERRVNLGLLVVAALLLDLILWTLILLGVESATIPADFASTHQPAFVFPFSHGLMAAVAWALLAGAAALLWYAKSGAAKFMIAAIVAVAVVLALAPRRACACSRVAAGRREFAQIGTRSVAQHAGCPWYGSAAGVAGTLALSGRRSYFAQQEDRTRAVHFAHPRIHRLRDDACSAAAVRHRHGGEFAGHHTRRLRSCGVAGKADCMRQAFPSMPTSAASRPTTGVRGSS